MRPSFSASIDTCNFISGKSVGVSGKSIFYEHMIEFTQIAIPLEKF